MFADSTLGKHPIALSFSIQGFNLGGGLMGKYWLSENYCLRTALTGTFKDYNYGDIDWSRYTRIDINIGLTRQYCMRNNLSLYVGGLVGFGWQESWYGGSSQGISRIYMGSIVLGVEYWLSSGLSLSGEQEIIVRKTFGEQTNDYDLSSSNSNIILSVYF